MTLLTPWITEAYRASIGRAPLDPTHTDYLAAFRADASLVDAARAEVASLAQKRGMRTLAEHDYESRQRHDTLVRMLGALEG